MAGLKLQHRNLHVPDTCPACDDATANQLHYCKCGVIHSEFWKPILDLLATFGMPQPANEALFIATGTLDPTQTISKELSGIWYLSWRALYAELMAAWIDEKRLDLEKALKRVVAMTISRLRAYGARWNEWVTTSAYQSEPKTIGPKHQDKTVITQDPDGDYQIATPLWDLATKLKLR